MSTGLIIAIVVVALILHALLVFVLPRARRTAQVKARERELEQRRERVAGEQRAEAEERRGQAEMAEQRAQMAASEARRERAEAELREQRAQAHERGMADDELIDESERDRFAGTSATEPPRATDEDRPMHEPAEQGGVDEREGRFRRTSEPERTDDPSRSRPV